MLVEYRENTGEDLISEKSGGFGQDRWLLPRTESLIPTEKRNGSYLVSNTEEELVQ